MRLKSIFIQTIIIKIFIDANHLTQTGPPHAIGSSTDLKGRSGRGGVPMQSFAYVAARTLDEAADHLSNPGKQSNILAGGTDLIVQLRESRRKTDLLVDIEIHSRG